ncbi:MAG: Slp family lipoprotein [Thermodesulfobacteriota bacterium]
MTRFHKHLHTIGARCLTSALVFFLCACSPISPQLKREVNPAITLARLMKDAQRFKDETVLLGGRIIGTQVKKNQTIIEVLQFPLDYQDRPDPSGSSEGRFLVTLDQYLDPAIFAEDRLITVVGRVAGTKTGKIGGIEYTYPLLAARGVHLWEVLYGPPAFTFGFGIGAHIH